MGCDRTASTPCCRTSISIHAPTWGATQDGLSLQSVRDYFNPRTHMGCDDITSPFGWSILGFQSTHPHGVRRNGHNGIGKPEPLFQSTHPHGVRLSPNTLPAVPEPFQSTHPHGVRRSTRWYAKPSFVFQSTHPHGVRLTKPPKHVRTAWKFQSTHPHGVRRWTQHRLLHRRRFQSTHPHGVRLLAPTPPCRRAVNFNPRTHMGCDNGTLPQEPASPNFNPRTHMGCDCKNNAI